MASKQKHIGNKTVIHYSFTCPECKKGTVQGKFNRSQGLDIECDCLNCGEHFTGTVIFDAGDVGVTVTIESSTLKDDDITVW